MSLYVATVRRPRRHLGWHRAWQPSRRSYRHRLAQAALIETALQGVVLAVLLIAGLVAYQAEQLGYLRP